MPPFAAVMIKCEEAGGNIGRRAIKFPTASTDSSRRAVIYNNDLPIKTGRNRCGDHSLQNLENGTSVVIAFSHGKAPNIARTRLQIAPPPIGDRRRNPVHFGELRELSFNIDSTPLSKTPKPSFLVLAAAKFSST